MKTTKRRIFKMSEDQYLAMRADYGGFCIACGEEAFGVEPDACEYDCESCGERTVFGIEELLMMGKIELED